MKSSVSLWGGAPLAVGAPARAHFPIFKNQERLLPNGTRQPLTFLDSAASSQKAQVVIDAMVHHMQHDYGPVHRGAYGLSVRSTALYEEARALLAAFVGPSVSPEQVVFTHGTTEALNTVASGFAEAILGPDDRIVIGAAEHHANLVPWQQAALRSGCEVAYIPFDWQDGSYEMLLEKAEKIITPNTKVIAVAHVGNVLGQKNPIEALGQMAQKVGAYLIVDAAQSVSCLEENVLDLGAHALAFGAHKMYGPTGVGVWVAKKELLSLLPPFVFGGGMISDVTLQESRWAGAPARFEAGTPPVTEIVGFARAAQWLGAPGLRSAAHAHCAALAKALRQGLQDIPGVKVFSGTRGNETLVSFRHESIHAHDLATVLDGFHVAVRAGHHCAWPLVRALGVDALLRASFGIYNDFDDVERCLQAIKAAPGVFR